MPVGNNVACGAVPINILAASIPVALPICTEAIMFVNETFLCADAVRVEFMASACSSSMAS